MGYDAVAAMPYAEALVANLRAAALDEKRAAALRDHRH